MPTSEVKQRVRVETKTPVVSASSRAVQARAGCSRRARTQSVAASPSPRSQETRRVRVRVGQPGAHDLDEQDVDDVFEHDPGVRLAIGELACAQAEGGPWPGVAVWAEEVDEVG